MTTATSTTPFDPLRPAPGESINLHREKLLTWAELRGPVSKGEWETLCSLAGIPPYPDGE